MKKPFRLTGYNDPNRPQLNFCVSYRANGKRTRKFFGTRKEAQIYADAQNLQFAAQGKEGVQFSTSPMRVEATACVEKLKPWNKTLTQAVDYFCEMLKASARSCTVGKLTAEFICAKEKDGASKSHLEDLRGRLAKFCSSHGERNAATITHKDVDSWLRALPLGPTSRNNFRKVLNTLFAYALANDYAASNPVAKTARAKVATEPVGILNPSEAAALLTACEPDLLPYVAIGLFAGLRRSELQRLTWDKVSLAASHGFAHGHIKVESKKVRSKQRRLVPVSANLASWLHPVAKHTGTVTPRNLKKRLDRVRKGAGLAAWPTNCLRHSFGSYRIADCSDVARVSMEMGNTPQVIFNHYREVVTPAEAARFWSIVPSTAKEKIVAFTAK